MSANQPERKRGKRGKRSGNAVKERNLYALAREHRNNRNTSQVIEDRAKYHQISEIEETAETHVIPRRSITSRQLLGIFPQEIETEPIPGRQLDKKATPNPATVADAKMIQVNNNRVTWKSDKSLLIPGKPTAAIGTFKREGAIREGQNTRKYRESIKETATVTVTGTDANGKAILEVPETIKLVADDL